MSSSSAMLATEATILLKQQQCSPPRTFSRAKFALILIIGVLFFIIIGGSILENYTFEIRSTLERTMIFAWVGLQQLLSFSASFGCSSAILNASFLCSSWLMSSFTQQWNSVALLAVVISQASFYTIARSIIWANLALCS